MASAGCRTSRATGRRRRSSRPTRSATSTSTSPRCAPNEGKLHMFVAIDRTSKFAFVELHEKATTPGRRRVPAAPDRGRSLQDPHRAHRQRHPVHDARRRWLGRAADQGERSPAANSSVLTPSNTPAPEPTSTTELTKPKHPWTNGQVERMNRTIKDATVKRFHYESHEPASSSTLQTSSRPTTSAAG